MRTHKFIPNASHQNIKRKYTCRSELHICFRYKLYCRTYQCVMQTASYFLPWRKPVLLEGFGCLDVLPDIIVKENISCVLIVTDKDILSLGLINGLLNGLQENHVRYFIYDKTVPNPTSDNIEEAFNLYQTCFCEAIIAFGGGSPIDCAKGVGAKIAKPNKTLMQMKGVLRIRKQLPPLFAIPTTAGTGSEATIAAVISDSRTHVKYQINDISLIPHFAVLDPQLTLELPKHITSTTGMDALTHAVEAYIGKSNTRETRQLSKQAVRLIFDNIYTAYSDGTNVTARANMLKASYYAGIAFTRAYVGYVHALSHALGGQYGIPHGLANAVILPYVLEYYGDSIYKQLAELADAAEIGLDTDSNEQKANQFIGAIRALNHSMNIPEKIEGIDEKDIFLLVERAFKEANPFYPVPKILSRNDLTNMIHMIRK